jgi:hypothetical protein
MPIGFYGKFYYRSSGDYSAPVWSEVAIIDRPQAKFEWDRAEAPTRLTRVKTAVKSMSGFEFTFRLLRRPGNAYYEALVNASLTDEVLDVLILNGDRTADGTRGFRFDGQVFHASEDQALSEVMYHDMLILPTPSDHPFLAVLVQSGELTYHPPGGDSVDFS